MNEPCQLCQTTTRHACDSLDPNMRTYTNRGAALLAARILSDDNELHVAIDGPFDGECTVMTAEQALDAGFLDEEEEDNEPVPPQLLNNIKGLWLGLGMEN